MKEKKQTITDKVATWIWENYSDLGKLVKNNEIGFAALSQNKNIETKPDKADVTQIREALVKNGFQYIGTLDIEFSRIYVYSTIDKMFWIQAHNTGELQRVLKEINITDVNALVKEMFEPAFPHLEAAELQINKAIIALVNLRELEQEPLAYAGIEKVETVLRDAVINLRKVS